MTPTANLWWELLARTAAAVGLVTGIGVILSCRIRAAVWRRTVWQIVVAGSLLLLLAELSGAGRVLTFWLKAPQPSAPAKRRAASVQVVIRPVPVDAERPLPGVSFDPSLAAPRPRQEPAKWPGLAWAGGCAVLAIWRLAQGATFFRLRRRMRAVTDAELEERVHRLARRLGIRRRVRLLESDRLAGPIAFGVWCRGIGLPTQFERDFPRSQQDAMLAHELAHLAAHDPFWQRLANLLVALLWWHPLVWWARRQLRVASELAADEASLLVENGPDALAESLVTLGRRLLERPAPNWLGVEGMSFRSGLGRRVERLLRLPGGCWPGANRWRARLVKVGGVAGLLTLVVVVGAWIQPEQAARTFPQAWEQSITGQALAALAKLAAHPRLAQADVKPASPGTPASSPHNTTPVTSTNLVPPAAGRADLLAKLERIVLPTVHFENCSLGEAIEELARLARVHDPDRRGINFIVSSALPSRDAPRRVDPGTGSPRDTETAVPLQDLRLSFGPAQNIWLQNVALQKVLGVLLGAAGTPLKYSVEDNAVVLSRKDIETPPLYTRFFKVDWTRLHGELGLSPNEAASRQSEPVRFIATNSATVIPRLRDYLSGLGVDLTPPKAIFYNDRLEMLVTRATLRDLEVIETALQKLNPPPQVLIEVKLCQVESAGDATVDLDQLQGEAAHIDQLLGGVLTNYARQAAQPGSTNAALATATCILTDPQLRVVLRALEQRTGVDMLAAPKLTTLSGRQAQIKVAEVKQVVTGLLPEPAPGTLVSRVGVPVGPARLDGTNAAPRSRPITEPVELGTMVDVVPRVQADGYTIEMNVTATVREMIGYDMPPEPAWDFVGPGNTPTLSDLQSLPSSTGPDRVASSAGPGGGMPVANRQPRPVIGVREARANLKVWDGQTLVLSGGSAFIELKDKDRWARSRWPQPAEPGAASPPRKRLLVFLTPRIVNAAGNPVHADEEFPERLRSVPPQGPLEGK